jgi:hypothetical protein
MTTLDTTSSSTTPRPRMSGKLIRGFLFAVPDRYDLQTLQALGLDEPVFNR